MEGYNAKEFIGNEYINKEDINNNGRKWVIMGVIKTEFEDKKNGKITPRLQLDIQMREIKKKFTLNTKNTKALINLYGQMTHGWIGKIIYLVVTKTNDGKDSIEINEDLTKETNMFNNPSIETMKM